MPLSFPASPTTGQQSTQNGRTWAWSGAAWELVAASGGGADARWNLFLPAAPTSVTATAGNTQATVSWTAPSVLAQTPITDYVVEWTPAGGSASTVSTGSATASYTKTGLTNGTAYTFRIAAINGVGQGAWSSASSAVTPTSDAFAANIALLLNGNGNFTDSSPTPTTVTAYGSAAANGSPKYGSNSMVFGGGGDYIAASGARFNFGTGNFTVEAWIFVDSHDQQWRGIMGAAGAYDGEPGYGIFLKSSTNRLIMLTPGVGSEIEDSAAFPTGQWVHVALARQSGTARLYKDGVQIGSVSMNFSLARQSFLAGRAYTDWGNQAFAGRLDDIRVTLACRYPDGTTFTPPTAQ